MSEQPATCPWCHHEHLNATDCGVRILRRFSFASAAYNCNCSNKRRDGDGDSDGAGAAEGGAAGDGSVRPGGDSDVAAVAEQIARTGDKALTEIARIQAMQDEALPLLTAERDRLRAELCRG